MRFIQINERLYINLEHVEAILFDRVIVRGHDYILGPDEILWVKANATNRFFVSIGRLDFMEILAVASFFHEREAGQYPVVDLYRDDLRRGAFAWLIRRLAPSNVVIIGSDDEMMVVVE